MKNSKSFDSALYGVCERVRPLLLALDSATKQHIQEIRLRTNRPLCLTAHRKSLFLNQSGGISYSAQNALLLTKEDIYDSFRLICAGSLYAHTEELREGFIIMKNGHRAGVCGTLNVSGDMSNISSINIRIAREVIGACDPLFTHYKSGGVLIAGPPASGKTTLLRDFIRRLSNERGKRITVIDSRGELSASALGIAHNDLGINTDILLTADRAHGIEMALRTMYPDIIALDEIGTREELMRTADCFGSGAELLLSAHIGKKSDLAKKHITKTLLETKAVSTVCLLSRIDLPPEIIDAKELI